MRVTFFIDDSERARDTMFTESDIEAILEKHHGFFIEPDLEIIGRQQHFHGKIIDLLFRDKFDDLLLVELKRDIIGRKDVGQILEYSGIMTQEEVGRIRLMLIGSVIPKNFKYALDRHGIEYREITPKDILKYLEIKDPQILKSLKIKGTSASTLDPPDTAKEGKNKKGHEKSWKSRFEWVPDNIKKIAIQAKEDILSILPDVTHGPKNRWYFFCTKPPLGRKNLFIVLILKQSKIQLKIRLPLSYTDNESEISIHKQFFFNEGLEGLLDITEKKQLEGIQDVIMDSYEFTKRSLGAPNSYHN